MPDAIEMLEKDHQKVRSLLKRLTEAGNGAEKTREKLFAEIKQELTVHTQIEEEIFYPAFRKANEKEHGELYYEAVEEHHIVDEKVFPDVESADTGTDEFAGRAKVLRELVEHHAEDEETEMFPKAREVFRRTSSRNSAAAWSGARRNCRPASSRTAVSPRPARSPRRPWRGPPA